VALLLYYIDSNGRIKARYRKVNLWHPKRYSINSGHEVPVFKIKFGEVDLIRGLKLLYAQVIGVITTLEMA